MNRTVARLSAQALFGRRRGIVLMLIPGALLALVRHRPGAHRRGGRPRGRGRPRLHPRPAARRPARRRPRCSAPRSTTARSSTCSSKPVSRHVIAVSKYAAAWARDDGARRAAAPPLGARARPVRAAPGGRPRRRCGRRGHRVQRPLHRPRGADPARRRHRPALHAALGGRARRGLRRGEVGVDRSLGPRGRRAGSARSSTPAGLGVTYAVVATALVTAASVWFTGDRLRSFTLRGDE